MPRDIEAPADDMTAAAKLRHLADFMETLEADRVDMRTVHHPCGTAHCAWGWGETIGLFPRPADSDDDAGWAAEMESAEDGRSCLLGLTRDQFRHCFGIGYQFRAPRPALHPYRRRPPSARNGGGAGRKLTTEKSFCGLRPPLWSL